MDTKPKQSAEPTYDLTNKTAIVTGGNAGIRREVSLAFGRAGANVVVAARREAAGRETSSAVEDVGGTATFIRTDVTDEAQVENLVQETIETYGGLDYAVNNAGTEGRPGPIVETLANDWHRAIEVNLTGTWYSLRHELPVMTEGGAIVNTASVFGQAGSAGFGPYTAAKHGVVGLTRAAALEAAASGVRVNAISPGVIETDMPKRVFGDIEVARESMGPDHPVGRLGRAKEVAALAIWLCSDAASFVTGQAIPVDGGYLAK
jgi:NAD(P)-dependent dehydrogenase (short-subunit alcohol dehydrogenase family)